MRQRNAQTIISKAEYFVGTMEIPAGSNNVVFNTDYYGRKVSGAAYPWCCAFVWDVFRLCGASELFCGGMKTAYCPTVESYYKSKGMFHQTGQAGDLCLMDFGKGRASHIGIVKRKNNDGTYTVIEGNTSVSSNDNGGAVMIRTRKMSNIRGFARPAYNGGDSDNSSTYHTVKRGDQNEFVGVLQQALINKRFITCVIDGKKKELTVDNDFGRITETILKRYQMYVGLPQTGICDDRTWEKLL